MRLSLCMIVRDESRFLPGCLASVKGVVDEIVVVDTGSTDDTRAIARAAGAVVVDHAWDDDFAAARNAALPHATGDFVLVLDADERLAPGAGTVLRRTLEAFPVVLGVLPLHDASSLDATPEEVVSGAKALSPPVYLPRVMRRTPDLRWEDRVHESVTAWTVRHGSRAHAIEAPIVHFGAVPEIRRARSKVQRNRTLLERQCEENPDAPAPFAHLASERARSGDGAGARAAADQGWKALRSAMAGPGARPAVVTLASVRAQVALLLGDPATTLATIDEARGWSAEHPNYAFLAGQAAWVVGDRERAAAELASALAQRGGRWTDQVIEGATGWQCRVLLARVLQELGRGVAALAQWEAVAAENPDHTGAPLEIAAHLLAAGRPAEALRRLDARLTAGDAWLLAARATLALGDPATARVLALRAAHEPWVEPSRRSALGPLLTELAARAGQFQAGPGPFGTLGALVARTPFVHRAAVDDDALRVAFDALVAAGNVPGLASLRTRRAEGAVPGVRARMDAHLAARGLSWTEPADPEVVFVGGEDPSDAERLRALLSAHPDLWCPPPGTLVPGLDALAARGDADAEAAPEVRSRVQAALAANPGRRVVETSPGPSLPVVWLGGLFPRARFVCVLADPTAQASPAAAVEGAAGAPGRVLAIRRDDLTAAPRLALEQILAFLGERWDDAAAPPDEPAAAAEGAERTSTDPGAAAPAGAPHR